MRCEQKGNQCPASIGEDRTRPNRGRPVLQYVPLAGAGLRPDLATDCIHRTGHQALRGTCLADCPCPHYDGSTNEKVPMESLLIDVQAVASLLGCSTRRVYRLADGGKMPAPLKLGALVRWNRAAIDNWIADGCKPVRQVAARRPSWLPWLRGRVTRMTCTSPQMEEPNEKGLPHKWQQAC
jgi:excisionase family DNA binding protein